MAVDQSDRIIDLEALAAAVRERGVPCVIEQTGGGVATLFAGEGREDTGERVAAGPGWFAGPGWTLPQAHLDGFYVGPDDQGEGDAFGVRVGTVAQIAEFICGGLLGRSGADGDDRFLLVEVQEGDPEATKAFECAADAAVRLRPVANVMVVERSLGPAQADGGLTT